MAMDKLTRIGSRATVTGALCLGICLAALPSKVQAYDRYNDGCQTCHGQYADNPYNSPKGGPAWPSSLHVVHRASSYMNTDCGLCHTSGDNRNPYLGSSDGSGSIPGLGCVGCHGRDYGGSTGVSGVGLRAHHDAAGITSCAMCHGGDPVPLAESTLPEYYGTSGTNADYSCNDDVGLSEDWSGDGVGLDNDGDDVYDTSDPDCAAGGCGDGNLDAGETCDPPASCPTSCDDFDTCTLDTMNGSAATCDVSCQNDPILVCFDNDGCCASGCNSTNDNDCTPACGNSVVEAGETCDPPGTCPTSCDDSDVCTTDTLNGNAATCDVSCQNDAIVVCANGDGCCAPGCNSTNDNDCTASCGNSVVEAGETCDPPGTCPTSCDDSNVCTTDTLNGSAANCDASCQFDAIVVCANGDGCCAPGCNSTNDNDCTASCGNSVVEAGETCDPPGTCPTSCDDSDVCTTDTLNGSAANCDASCQFDAIVACANGDGCCAPGCDSTNDNDCTASCGNSVVEAGETCDPPGTCPTSCDDSNVCTTDTLNGSAANCDASCQFDAIVACANGDGCCAPGCDSTSDNDCTASCGNSVVEAGETCDPPGTCPTSCDDSDVCTTDTLNGSAANCDAACQFDAIVACANGDGCCAPGCDSTNDNDCTVSCGNSVVEAGETCDPPGTCPTSCDDSDVCTTDTLNGSAANCDASCQFDAILVCANGDGCCPAGCDSTNDNDCTATCGNSIVEAGETCDPPGTCPTTCDDSDVCTADTLNGSAANCDASCQFDAIVVCANGDGCCAPGCNATNDGDCTPSCGNSVVEAGESCDPPASCPTACDDGNVCTTDSLSGAAASCDAMCQFDPILACVGGDGCCPPGCDQATDADCVAGCGNGAIDLGETCDPPSSCPASCDDGNACTIDGQTGSAANCDLACTATPVAVCQDNDGCCPAGCTRTNDKDCSPSCGNGNIGADETCDPPSSCPTTCDDGNACTDDVLTGSAANCNVACSSLPIVLCVDNDGCCPAGCDNVADNDCSGSCGDGTVDPGETCDPPGTCPTDCDDGNACTIDVMTGSAPNCNVACGSVAIVSCANGDGCCPAGCDALSDSDCSASCGNSVVEPGETCDPPGTCPTDCDDGNSCTNDSMTGNAANCNVACTNVVIVSCAVGDSCCPAGCDQITDGDCSASCGNSVVEAGETCDPPGTCPTDCDDGNSCTNDAMTGSAASCNAACSNVVIVSCAGGDSCCPAGCDAVSDGDCSASCGNAVVEPGETCDPPGTCPTDCDDGNSCTNDSMTGNAANCNAACSNVAIVSCAAGDGCCPAGCDQTTDGDCSASCGNSVVEAGETCDPPGTCPTDCDDGNSCTNDSMTGNVANCNVACSNVVIVSCAGGDSCCPAGCDAVTDGDCSASCGNSVVEPGETCDPPGTCPTDCDDGNSCTNDAMTGNAANCNAACSNVVIVSCASGDGCCPAGCDQTTDSDCSASCGNSVVEAGETCDPPGTCPTDCDDGNSCTNDAMTGNAANCNVACSNVVIVSCAGGDSCCPAGCDAVTDGDCSASCGNSVVEAGETCDPPGTCPTDCDDGNSCTNDSMTGNAANCNAACSNVVIVSCANGDGCCPAGCDQTTDGDCSASCGNSVVESGETCDPPGSCPTSCDDGNSCTNDTLTGSAANCNAACSNVAIVSCAGGDGCCPAGCDQATDGDCSASCGNSVVEAGETCDPPSSCPADCDDSNACTNDTQTGSAANCNVACSNVAIVSCAGGDGCCPAGCDTAADNDCSASCGDDVVDPGETCDPPSSCPTDCDDSNACTNDTLTGSAASCSADCSFVDIVSCVDDDGCCPAGCLDAEDTDCATSPPASAKDAGCGCRTTGTPDAPWIGWLLLVLWLGWNRRRRR